MIKKFFQSVRMACHAKLSILRYRRAFRRKTDDELRAVVEHEKGLRAWCSERSYFLLALRAECERRGME